MRLKLKLSKVQGKTYLKTISIPRNTFSAYGLTCFEHKEKTTSHQNPGPNRNVKT